MNNLEPLNSNEFPIITNYCEDLTSKTYVTNPAIARDEEIKKTMLVLLTPDKTDNDTSGYIAERP